MVKLSYLALLKMIIQLQKDAEVARAKELPAIILLIRQKMAEWGITVADLGLKKKVPPVKRKIGKPGKRKL